MTASELTVTVTHNDHKLHLTIDEANALLEQLHEQLTMAGRPICRNCGKPVDAPPAASRPGARRYCQACDDPAARQRARNAKYRAKRKAAKENQ